MSTEFLFPGEESCIQCESGVRYAYCTERGEYFACTAPTEDAARARCEDWMMRQERY